MNQSQIALKVSNYLLLQNEILYRWKRKDTIYAIYGKWQTDMKRIRYVVEYIMNVDIKTKSRKMEVVSAKRLFIFLVLYTMPNQKLTDLADYLGFITHATVLHHRDKMKDLIEISDYHYIRLIKLACLKLDLNFIQTTEKHEES